MLDLSQKTLLINEIFYSIQGESTFTGLPCIFVRLTGCHLRCTYCDTEYAFYEGKERTVSDILKQIASYGCNLVEVTGGEPLLQPNVIPLMEELIAKGNTVMLETSGAVSLAKVPQGVKKIMDIKCPDSGMSHRLEEENIELLIPRWDEVKFVISSRTDYDWARVTLQKYNLEDRGLQVLFSPAFGTLSPLLLAQWMLEDRLPARLQLQLHKYIWPPDQRGV